jgi:hypothetical protein
VGVWDLKVNILEYTMQLREVILADGEVGVWEGKDELPWCGMTKSVTKSVNQRWINQ